MYMDRHNQSHIVLQGKGIPLIPLGSTRRNSNIIVLKHNTEI